MKIAVLSGKGGTGKTFVAVNLSSVIQDAAYVDCDVEEPNGHLFFKPNIISSLLVKATLPKVDNDVCTGCRKCVDFCKFNALAFINSEVMVFSDICHGCGGCNIVCKENAISEMQKEIGKIEYGISKQIKVITGTLNIGEESGVKIIEKMLSPKKEYAENVIIDCPPGSSCSVMESIKDADFCVMVAEPTIFGSHNLDMVYKLVKLFNIPSAVIINKYVNSDNPTEKYCKQNNIKIIGKIPYSKELATLGSNSIIASEFSMKYMQMFRELYKSIKDEVPIEAASNT